MAIDQVRYAEADPSKLHPPFDQIRRDNDATVYAVQIKFIGGK
eukprot:COSAG02_NODE_214_length_28689_cov_34.895523_17_plen_43_part_00